MDSARRVGEEMAQQSDVPRKLSFNQLGVMLLVGAAALLAVFCMRWISQDAFITLRYVENFWAGDGLVFNVGERVQGFTHPLWLLLLLAVSPEWSIYHAIWLGIAFVGVTLWAAGRLFRATPRPVLGFAAFCLAFYSSFSVLEWSTSGLENALTHACLAIVLAIALRGEFRRRRWLFAIALGALLFNRVDQLFLVTPIVMLALWCAAMEDDVAGANARRSISVGRGVRFAGVLLLGISPFILWLAFATFYYGFPLPNTSYAKLGGATRTDALYNGWMYIRDFGRYEPWHGALLSIGMIVAPLAAIRRRLPQTAVVVAAAVGIGMQLAFVIWVGGDYMRGRFIVSSLLVAAISTAYVLAHWPAATTTVGGSRTPPRWALPVVCVVFVLLLLPAWGVTLRERQFDPATGIARIWREYKPFVEIRDRNDYYTRTNINSHYRNLLPYARFNERLGVGTNEFAFHYTNLGDDTFGLGSRLRLVDMHGLVDPFVARCRPSKKNRAGHVQRAVPLAYLHERRVVNIQPNWFNRLVNCEASLADEARRAAETPQWSSPTAERVCHELEILTRAPLLDARRWPLIWKYTTSTPLAYDPAAPLPAIASTEITPELLAIAPELGGTLEVEGIEPSQYDFVDPRFSGKFWLGYDEPGEASLLVRVESATTAALSAYVEQVGPAVQSGRVCELRLYRDAELMDQRELREPGEVRFAVSLPAGEHRLRLRIPTPASGGRYYRDPRPLMLLLTKLRIDAGAVAQR